MKGKTKVVQLITTMADGGAETMVKDYALLCDKEQIDMTIISWSERLGSANERILEEAGVPVIYLGKCKGNKPKNIVSRAIGRINKYLFFRNYIIHESIDVIHIHLRFGIYIKLIPSKVLKRIKLFYTVHNEPDKFFDASERGRKYKEYCEANRLIHKYGLTVITLHDEMNKQICNMFGTDRVITINNGINFSRFDSKLYDRKKVREELGVDSDTFLLGHVGSFTKQKNHELLITIFEEYIKKNSNSKLLLVGRGILKQQIIEFIKDKHLQNYIIVLENRSDIPELMSTMDVFVLPSKWEGFPVVMLEAQKMGLPCVISNRINDEVVLTENVSMIDIDASVDEWIDAIDGHYMKMPIKGRFEDYDIKATIDRLQGLYV